MTLRTLIKKFEEKIDNTEHNSRLVAGLKKVTRFGINGFSAIIAHSGNISNTVLLIFCLEDVIKEKNLIRAILIRQCFLK